MLSKAEVFSGMNYGSKTVLGFCIKQKVFLTAEEIVHVLSAVLQTATLKPDVLLTPQGKVFKSEILIAFYSAHSFEHEAYRGKFKNNRIENFHSRVKGVLFKFFFKPVGLTGLMAKSFWSSVEKQKAANIGLIKNSANLKEQIARMDARRF